MTAKEVIGILSVVDPDSEVRMNGIDCELKELQHD